MADELNYLIVGGLSYIGLHITQYLLEKYPNVKLTILDLSSNTIYANRILKKAENYPQRCIITIGSSSNSELVKKILEERKINIVLYNVWNDDANATAVEKDHPGCFRKTLSYLTQFLEVLRCYGKLTKFILISSEEVYGNQTLKLETTATRPCSLKGAAVNACEMMLHSYIISYRIPALTVRLSAIIYGGIMDDNSLLNLEQDDSGKNETVGLLHIQDAVVGIEAALEKGQIGEVYNIGGQCDCSPFFVQHIAKLKKGVISSDEINMSQLTMSSTKAELQLLWKAKISQSEGIHEIIVKDENQWNETHETSTHKILVYGHDFALNRLSRLIENKKRYLPKSLQNENIIISKRSFDSNDVDINEIIDISPSHIVYISICDTLEENEISTSGTEAITDARSLLKTKLYAMLYVPWFLASFCNKRSIHFTYLTSCNPLDDTFFTEAVELADLPFISFEYLMAIDKFTDRLLQHFDNILFCRVGIIIDEEDESDKMPCFNLERSFYLSVLSDCIPPIFDLALKGHTGMVDVSNPIPLDDYDFRELCNQGNRPHGASVKLLPRKNSKNGKDE
uniref:NAD(P)-bd_dom domain-containing protein n=1 Tax=Onchocerca volvulus TaxID=6282 RepID=A0A8R1XSQ0_ONCVO